MDKNNIFISHASEDKKNLVEPFLKCLDQNGITNYWYDKEEIETGDIIVKRINEGLSTSKIGVIILRVELPWKILADPKIDLAVMPNGGLLNHLLQIGKRVYYTSISSSAIPQNEEWGKFIVLEDIFVIGYPNALMDSVNNLPIFRRGTTASHPKVPYEGRDEFLVDVGVYPGSSGSPFFLLNHTFYKKSRELEEGRDNGRLLRIISSGPMFTAGYNNWKSGVDGFGKRRRSTIHLEGITINMPLVMEVIDEQSRLEPLLPQIKRMVNDNVLVSLHEVEVF